MPNYHGYRILTDVSLYIFPPSPFICYRSLLAAHRPYVSIPHVETVMCIMKWGRLWGGWILFLGQVVHNFTSLDIIVGSAFQICILYVVLVMSCIIILLWSWYGWFDWVVVVDYGRLDWQKPWRTWLRVLLLLSLGCIKLLTPLGGQRDDCVV